MIIGKAVNESISVRYITFTLLPWVTALNFPSTSSPFNCQLLLTGVIRVQGSLMNGTHTQTHAQTHTHQCRCDVHAFRLWEETGEAGENPSR